MHIKEVIIWHQYPNDWAEYVALPPFQDYSIKLRGSFWLVRWITRLRWFPNPGVSLSFSILPPPSSRRSEGWLACLDIVRVKANLIPPDHSIVRPSLVRRNRATKPGLSPLFRPLVLSARYVFCPQNCRTDEAPLVVIGEKWNPSSLATVSRSELILQSLTDGIFAKKIQQMRRCWWGGKIKAKRRENEKTEGILGKVH